MNLTGKFKYLILYSSEWTGLIISIDAVAMVYIKCPYLINQPTALIELIYYNTQCIFK